MSEATSMYCANITVWYPSLRAIKGLRSQLPVEDLCFHPKPGSCLNWLSTLTVNTFSIYFWVCSFSYYLLKFYFLSKTNYLTGLLASQGSRLTRPLLFNILKLVLCRVGVLLKNSVFSDKLVPRETENEICGLYTLHVQYLWNGGRWNREERY